MKSPQFLRLALSVGLCLAAVAPGAWAEDTTPPYVFKAISNIKVSANSGAKVVSLKKVFRLKGVTGETVRFKTTIGDVDVELFADKAPKTVAAFLKIAAAPSPTGYSNTLIHRAIPSFIVQGGGFHVDDAGTFTQITSRPAIPSEAGIKNTRGTLAMALSRGPDSGTGDFFFNLVANTSLDDSSNGGPFTVFGRAIGDISLLDKIAALPQLDLSKQMGFVFMNIPLVHISAGGATIADLLYLNSITPVPLVAQKEGMPSILGFKVKNTNKSLVIAKISGPNLTLTPVRDMTGVAKIQVFGSNKDSGDKAIASFIYTVQ